MTKEAMKLALEALELEDMACRYEKDPTPEHIAKAITALREALAEQEPFGYLSIGDSPIFQKEKPEIGRWETLYTTPPQRTWVDLTRDDILDLFDVNNVYGSKWIEFARAVEAKLKEKNHD